MNDPIISPLWFYMVHVVIAFQIILGIIAIPTFIFVIMVVFAVAFEGEDSKVFQLVKRNKKGIIVFYSIIFFAFMIVPSDQAIYRMMAASYVTPANILEVKDFSVETIKEIAEAIKGEAGHGQE